MAKATSFGAVVALIRAAEDLLIKKAGQTSPLDRVSTLRGVYYGTLWSLDYKVESVRSTGGANIRNLGFLTYTGGTIPADPRPAFAGTSIMADLQASQSIRDRGRGIDIGHMLIGLETRSSQVLRTQNFTGQGGTGLEIVTWLGDLGGGAANLAKRRILRPTSVEVIFHNRTSDYGVMDNLEGDAAGYLVACGTTPGGPRSTRRARASRTHSPAISLWGARPSGPSAPADSPARSVPRCPLRESSTRLP